MAAHQNRPNKPRPTSPSFRHYNSYRVKRGARPRDLGVNPGKARTRSPTPPRTPHHNDSNDPDPHLLHGSASQSQPTNRTRTPRTRGQALEKRRKNYEKKFRNNKHKNQSKKSNGLGKPRTLHLPHDLRHHLGPIQHRPKKHPPNKLSNLISCIHWLFCSRHLHPLGVRH